MNRTKDSVPKRAVGLRLLCISLIFGFGCNVVLAQTVGSNEGGTLPQPVPEFPAFNWWNTDISRAPVDPNSAKFIKFINNGSTRHLHPDFGGNATDGGTYGIYGFPYVVVDGVAGTGKTPPPLQAVQFGYYAESDGVNHTTNTAFPFYPIPAQAITTPRWIECGDPGSVDDRDSCDRHLLIIDRDHKYLYEMWNVWYDTANSQWNAGSGAFFDMTKSARRPAGWTSADAAGLAIFPGLVRYDEVYDAYGTDASAIRHAFRVTLRSTNGYVYPASHDAGSTAGALPMGARLRLKANTVITSYPPAMQKIFQAMKTYGLIVADNGSDMYISGTYDTNWDNGVLNPAFGGLSASDFEVIQQGWVPPIFNLTATPDPVVGGTSVTATLALQNVAPTGGAVVTLLGASPLTVPASVTVPAGQRTASFTVATAAVTGIHTNLIIADYLSSEFKTVVTIEPPPALTKFAVNPTTVSSGGKGTGTVTLNEAAPSGGVKFTLSSSNTAVATVPVSVTVPDGSNSASFTVTGKTLTTKQSATISASYSGVTENVTFTVQPGS